MASKGLDNSRQASQSLEVKGNRLLGSEYIYYLDKGRGPGKFPPMKNIQDWILNKLGLDAYGKDKGVAFVIGRKIAREGTGIFKNSSKGIQLDLLVESMLEDLTKELPNEMAAEALKWV
jgi:hypothetical protein